MAGGDKNQPPIAQPLHPATTVTNIKNQIPITLTSDDNTYNSWVALFKVQCTVCRVLDHIIPEDTAPSEHDEEWKRLDAIVLQWIYSTISTDLLTTILKVDNTAAKAWSALERLFLDSKPTRALHLQQKFYNTKQASFTSAAAYCQELKRLSDQLSNVDVTVTDQTLVLQLISGLSPEYDNFATTLQQADTFPSFETARSKLVLEEGSKAKRLADAPTALHTTRSTSQIYAAAPEQSQNNSTGRGNDSSRGRGRGNRGRGGRGRSRGRGQSYSFYNPPGYLPTPHGYSPMSPWLQQPSHNPWSMNQWASPPCPYPTAPQHRPPARTAPGILGAAPSANYASSEYSVAPTNIEQALHTMSLNQDQNWYMDTGATSHMAHNPGFPDQTPHF